MIQILPIGKSFLFITTHDNTGHHGTTGKVVNVACQFVQLKFAASVHIQPNHCISDAITKNTYSKAFPVGETLLNITKIIQIYPLTMLPRKCMENK